MPRKSGVQPSHAGSAYNCQVVVQHKAQTLEGSHTDVGVRGIPAQHHTPVSLPIPVLTIAALEVQSMLCPLFTHLDRSLIILLRKLATVAWGMSSQKAEVTRHTPCTAAPHTTRQPSPTQGSKAMQWRLGTETRYRGLESGD